MQKFVLMNGVTMQMTRRDILLFTLLLKLDIFLSVNWSLRTTRLRIQIEIFWTKEQGFSSIFSASTLGGYVWEPTWLAKYFFWKNGMSSLLVLLNRRVINIWMRFHKGFDYIVQSKVLGKYYMTCQKLIQTMHILTQWSSCPFHFYILSKSVLSWNNTMPIVKKLCFLAKNLQSCGQLKQHKTKLG